MTYNFQSSSETRKITEKNYDRDSTFLIGNNFLLKNSLEKTKKCRKNYRISSSSRRIFDFESIRKTTRLEIILRILFTILSNDLPHVRIEIHF